MQIEVSPAPTQAEATTEVVAPAGLNALADESWSETPPPAEPVQNQPEAPAEQATTPAASTTESTPTVDPNLKELGFDDWATAKTQITELRKLKDADTTAPVQFANEQSKKFFDAIKEGKEDDILSYLSEKKRFEKAEAMDVSKAADAAELIKLSLQYKHKELAADEVDYLFNRKYAMPKKPVQTDDQTDEEYEESVTSWKGQVADAERAMIIDAKLAKPELAQYKAEIKLPDIPKAEQAQAGPSQEELAQAQQAQEAYLSEVNRGITDLKGFQVAYKDEAVEIPLTYEITPEEKAQIKPIMESLFTDFGYFHKRWAKPDGTFDTVKMGEDLYMLENQNKVFQKFANQAGTQRLAHKIKEDSNIQLSSGPQKTFVPDNAAAEADTLVKEVWGMNL